MPHVIIVALPAQDSCSSFSRKHAVPMYVTHRAGCPDIGCTRACCIFDASHHVSTLRTTAKSAEELGDPQHGA